MDVTVVYPLYQPGSLPPYQAYYAPGWNGSSKDTATAASTFPVAAQGEGEPPTAGDVRGSEDGAEQVMSGDHRTNGGVPGEMTSGTVDD